MKKTFLFIIFLLSTINIAVAQFRSEVNECFELTSIVFRLADVPEYVNNELLNYTNDIDHYFNKHKKHKLIFFIKEIREKYGISYDAVADAAAFLEIKNGEVGIKSGIAGSEINGIDSRWTDSTFQTFVNYLNDFYKKTKFNVFYLQHKDLYNIAVERMDELLKNVNFNWFRSFFGVELEESLVVVSLCNGSHNYAFSTPKNNGIVMGCAADDKGLPFFNEHKALIIVHELLHHHTNPLILSYRDQIDSSAQKIYSYIKDDINKQAYGDAHVAMSEWFTNLFSIIYIQENPILTLSIEHLIRDLHNQGFVWTDRSVVFMKHFLKNRGQYVYINDYMPQIIGFINYTADNFDLVLNEYINRRPYVVDIFPIPGTTITSDIDTIEIRFSEPMFGAHGIKAMNDENILQLPFLKMPFWKDEYTYVILLDTTQLEKGRTYGGKLIRDFFQSAKTYAIEEDYTYLINIAD